MNLNSDEMYEKFKDNNFAEAKPVSQIPALVKLQSESGNNITMQVDNDVLVALMARAEATGSNYHTIINEALKQFLQGQTLVDVVRQTIQQELRHN